MLRRFPTSAINPNGTPAGAVNGSDPRQGGGTSAGCPRGLKSGDDTRSQPVISLSSPRRPQASTPSRRPSRGPHGEAARASLTATNDREPPRGSPAAENRAATSNPNTARQCLARWRSPRNSQPCACGSNAPAATTARPSSTRNKAGTPSRQTDQNRPRSALPEADRKTHAPASTASPPRSRSDRLAGRPHAPSPSLQTSISPPASHRINQTRLRQRAANPSYSRR